MFTLKSFSITLVSLFFISCNAVLKTSKELDHSKIPYDSIGIIIYESEDYSKQINALGKNVKEKLNENSKGTKSLTIAVEDIDSESNVLKNVNFIDFQRKNQFDAIVSIYVRTVIENRRYGTIDLDIIATVYDTELEKEVWKGLVAMVPKMLGKPYKRYGKISTELIDQLKSDGVL